MNQKAEHLYGEMQQDMKHCRRKELSRLSEVECCFQMAERYWVRLRQEVAEYEFEKIADEIKFFKVIKPLFTAEVEFYSLRYHAELFRRDVTDVVELERFWNRERLRPEKFAAEHAEFYAYYKGGSSSSDELYFVRRNSDLSNFPRAKVYDLDQGATTSHDGLVSTIMALERYMNFIDKEIEALHELKNDGQ